jgi:hypothetical protein
LFSFFVFSLALLLLFEVIDSEFPFGGFPDDNFRDDIVLVVFSSHDAPEDAPDGYSFACMEGDIALTTFSNSGEDAIMCVRTTPLIKAREMKRYSFRATFFPLSKNELLLCHFVVCFVFFFSVFFRFSKIFDF